MSVEDAKVDWIEFDLDGVLAVEQEKITCSEDHEKALPFEPAILLLKAFKEAGFRIRINTARWEDDYDVTEKWLNAHGIPFDELLVGKPQYVLKIDDRTINTRTLKAVDKMGEILGNSRREIAVALANMEKDYDKFIEENGGK